MAFTPLQSSNSAVSQGGFVPLNASAPTPVAPTPQVPAPAPDFMTHLGNIASSITDFLGLHGTVDTLGTNAANIGNVLNPNTSLDQKIAMSKTLPQTSLEQNVGAGVQLGSTLAAGGNPASTLGKVALGAAIGAGNMGGASMAQNSSAGDVAKQTAIGGALGGATAGAVAGLGHLIGATGDKIMTSVIKPSKNDIADGFSLQTLKDYNLGGSLNTTMDKTQAALGDLSKQLNDKLAGSTATINLNDPLNQTIQELTDSSKLKGFGANGKILTALDNLKNEVGMVNGEGGISIPDAQTVKQAAGSFGAWQYGKVDPESKAQEIVYNTFYSKLKTAIEDNSPAGVQAINKELGRLIPIQNAVLRRLPVAERSGLISLNDMIGLVGSTAHPAALGPTILNMVSKSGAAGSLLSKLGPAAARLAIPVATGASAIGSQVSQQSNTSSGQSQ